MSDEHPTIGDMTYELLKKMRAEQQEMWLKFLTSNCEQPRLMSILVGS